METKSYSRRTALKAAALLGTAATPFTLLHAQPRPDYNSLQPIHFAWNPTAAPVNQFGAALMRTDIGRFWGLDLKGTPFASAAEMISAAASNAVDVYWSSDGPMGGALARGLKFTVIAEHGGWVQGVAVQKDSPIQSMADLKGKKVGVHEGTTTALYVRDLVAKAGVDVKDVNWINVPIGEQGGAFASKAVDAVMSWAPVLELLPNSRHIYHDAVGIGKAYPGTILAVRTDFAEKEREKAVRFLGALMHANLWAALNADTVNTWYLKEVKIDPAILKGMLDKEPLWNVKSVQDLDYRVAPGHVARMTETANAFARNARLTASVDYSKLVDNSLFEEAKKRALERIPQANIKVVKP
jgi:ABC-type nitrate/sulfonate/bicarbonate transport system substrate-binding protein